MGDETDAGPTTARDERFRERLREKLGPRCEPFLPSGSVIRYVPEA